MMTIVSFQSLVNREILFFKTLLLIEGCFCGILISRKFFKFKYMNLYGREGSARGFEVTLNSGFFFQFS